MMQAKIIIFHFRFFRSKYQYQRYATLDGWKIKLFVFGLRNLMRNDNSTKQS
jgi:hypothetical protein